jgi:hypothetical protein
MAFFPIADVIGAAAVEGTVFAAKNVEVEHKIIISKKRS